MDDVVTVTATSILTPSISQAIAMTTTVTSGEIGVTSQELNPQLLFFDRTLIKFTNWIKLRFTALNMRIYNLEKLAIIKWFSNYSIIPN